MSRMEFSGREWFAEGHFAAGCNYWASHAGTSMWREWQPEVVAADLRRLSEGGVEVVRAFPLWSDFQPLHLLRQVRGAPMEYTFGNAPLPDNPYGRAGVSEEMMGRFAWLLDELAKNRLVCIVALLNGWMSGRLFVPPAIEGRALLTDPVALRWQVRFIRLFVERFREHPAIVAWNPGNECNCLGHATRDEAYAWAALINQTIRVADPTRPVISGMHALSAEGVWTFEDQGELADVLTTHPYPAFTPHCNLDPINTMRNLLHSTAESRLYADLGGKPALCEEIGTLGPMFASEEVAGDYMRNTLFSLWAHRCHGSLWWCASDFNRLTEPPYDWFAIERTLGLLRDDGSAKPVLNEMQAFTRLMAELPCNPLPLPRREAVVILTHDQDNWGIGFATFILAKQAGFDVEFQHASQPLREAEFYLMPSVSGSHIISQRRLKALLERVAAGATLYLSLGDALPGEFEAMTGLKPQTRSLGRAPGNITLEGIAGVATLPNDGAYKTDFKTTRATVYGREADGNPAFTCATYGAGRIFFLAVPLEANLITQPGVFHAPESAYWRLYRYLAAEFVQQRALLKENPLAGITEHDLAADRRVAVVINYSPESLSERLQLASGWQLQQVLHGNVEAEASHISVTLRRNDAAILLLKHQAVSEGGASRENM